MKKLSGIIWGIVLIAAGVILGLNAIGITDIDIFFDGWWTLFIIIPCTVGLFTEQGKLGNIIGIAIGIFLLLCCQDILSFDMFWKLLIPTIIVIIGVKMVFGGFFGNKAHKIFSEMKEKGTDPRVCCATFSGNNINYDGEVFDGEELTAVFGGIKCDLRNAIIDKDCAIKACAIFGGIDIIVPDNINIKINSNSIFGGVSNKKDKGADGITLYIDAACIFGGVDIK